MKSENNLANEFGMFSSHFIIIWRLEGVIKNDVVDLQRIQQQ